MLKYVSVRLLQAIPVLLGITVVSFLLIHLVPGDPARLQLGSKASAAQVAALRHQLGLDQSIPSQYLKFLHEAIELKFGTSVALHQSVGGVIGQKIGVTVILLFYSVLISLLIAVPLGVFAAISKDRPSDHVIRAVGMVFFVMPAFWLGLLLTLIFGLMLGIFPTSGYESGLAGVIKTLTLPALTLGLIIAPVFLRSLRASIVGALDAGYAESALAKGFSHRRILVRHVLKNASIPLVTLVGLMAGYLISGMVIVESVFALPGLGAQLVSSVSARDFPMVQGLVLALAVMVVLVNLITDLFYAWIDPRIRL